MASSTHAVPHPVLDVLRGRALTGSRPGRRSDPHRVGLALEGGAMRGVVSAGMVTALERLGLLACFDAVYGTSAGAVNGAYFLAGQAAYGTPIYYEHINNLRFLNPFRYFGSRPVVALDYVFDRVLTRERPLDWRAVLDSPVILRVVAFSLSRQAAVALGPLRDRESLFLALRASACIPLMAGPPVSLDGDAFVDASIVEPVPFRAAIADGCTHVLCLLTWPADGADQARSLYTGRLIAPRVAGFGEGLRRAYSRYPHDYRTDVHALHRATRRPDGAPFVYAVAPSERSGRLSRLERRRSRLVRGAREGERAVTAVLGPSADLTNPAGPRVPAGPPGPAGSAGPAGPADSADSADSAASAPSASDTSPS